MVLVDSNIVFALMVSSTPWHAAARELHRQDNVWATEAHALVEVSNVLSRYVRVRELTRVQALSVMHEVEQRLRSGLHNVGPVDALAMAIDHKVSAYDARFLVCARNLGARLVTEDVKLRIAAPSLTMSLDEAVAT